MTCHTLFELGFCMKYRDSTDSLAILWRPSLLRSVDLEICLTFVKDLGKKMSSGNLKKLKTGNMKI